MPEEFAVSDLRFAGLRETRFWGNVIKAYIQGRQEYTEVWD